MKTAIVISAGMAGLVCAAIAARHFDNVIVLEKDTLPADATPRTGVPQGRHVHNLLSRGDTTLGRLFPSLFKQLEVHGAQRVDWSKDVRWHHHGVWKNPDRKRRRKLVHEPATLQADVLDTLLAVTPLDDVHKAAPGPIAKVVQECWAAVASEDFRHPETTGDKMPGAGLVNWYTRRVHRRASFDARTETAFLKVMHMEKGFGSLFHPRILIPALLSPA